MRGGRQHRFSIFPLYVNGSLPASPKGCRMFYPSKPPGTPDAAAISTAGRAVNCRGTSFGETLDRMMQERVRGNAVLDHLLADERDLCRRLADAADPEALIRQAVVPLIRRRASADAILAAGYRQALAYRCDCGLGAATVEEIVRAELAKVARHG